ncbi:MAG: HYExAFE family protein [Thermoguttaceae bacterium]|nr:HYExAFE family protein [Thermoguttaceae bacterium]
MKKDNHYERVFEAYIQFLGLPYVATRERRRSLIPENPDNSLKNFDFIVSTTQIFPPESWTLAGGKDFAGFFASPVSFLPSTRKEAECDAFSSENGFRAKRKDFGGNSFSTEKIWCSNRKKRKNLVEFKEGESSPNKIGKVSASKESSEIYYRPCSLSWLIDIKGRRFPSGRKQPQYWRNWVTSEDELGLLRWEGIFGQGFHGAFVFVYDVCGERLPIPEERLFVMNGHQYAFFFIPLAIYRTFARVLSSKWETETMPTALFQKYAVPLDEFFGAGFCAR